MNFTTKQKTTSLPSIMEDFFTESVSNQKNNKRMFLGSNSPLVNIFKSDQNYIIDIATPGLSKEDFNIELKNDKLIVSSQKEEKTNLTSIRNEFSFYNFKRDFKLEKNTFKKEAINASYENGILQLTLPLLDNAKEVNKRITIA